MILSGYSIFILYNATHHAVHELGIVRVRVRFPDFEVLQPEACFMGLVATCCQT